MIQDHIPVCLAGENPAPLDDMGGIPGYYMWLDALRDPSHEMHDDAIDWFGKDFLSEGFDLAKVNKRLSAEFKLAPKKRRKKRK